MLQTYQAHPAELARIRGHVRDLASHAGLAPARVEDLVLAVSEASANAIVHSGTETVTITWQEGNGRIDIEIRDGGRFRRRVPMPEVDGVGGHGIPLMIALVDEISIREGTTERPGTVVSLSVQIAPAAATG